jgi:hypothetical protein
VSGTPFLFRRRRAEWQLADRRGAARLSRAGAWKDVGPTCLPAAERQQHRTRTGGLDVVRRKAKEWFHKNRNLTDEVQIKQAVARGRYCATRCGRVLPWRLHGQLRASYSLCPQTQWKRAHAASGRWYVRNELTAVIQFKKYRVMRERYSEP